MSTPRLELALRKEKGRKMIGKWRDDLTNACGLNVSAESFLSIEKTEAAKAAFFERVRAMDIPSAKRWWTHLEQDDVASYLVKVARKLDAIEVILFSSVDDCIGAIHVQGDRILENAFSVWKVVGQDLCIATDDLENGLCLEKNFYNQDADYDKNGVFELTAWGMMRLVE